MSAPRSDSYESKEKKVMDIPVEKISATDSILLQSAVEAGDLDAVDLLLKNKADPNLKNKEGHSPVYYELRKWHWKIAALLLEHTSCLRLCDYLPAFHLNIIHLLQKTGLIESGINGACNGLSMLFVTQYLISKPDNYIKLFTHHGVRSSADFKKKEEKRSDENETLAFLNTVALFQEPKNYRHIIGKYSNQTNHSRILAITASKQLEEKGGAVELYSDIVFYNLLEWSAYLTALRAIFQEENLESKKIASSSKLVMKIALNYIPSINKETKEINYDNGHGLGVSYDAESDRWFLADPNLFPFNIPDMREDEFKSLFPKEEKIPDNIIKNSTLPYLWTRLYYRDNASILMPGRVNIFTTKDNPRFSILLRKFNKLWNSTPSYCPSLTDLLKRKAGNGYTIVELAAELDCVKKIKQLKKAGASLTEFDNEGDAPIHTAVRSHSLKTIEYFIKQKHNLNLARSTDNNTPAILAAALNHLDILELLFQAKVNLNGSRPDGLAPAHVAAMKNHPDVIKFLFYLGVNINALTSEGFAPLHYAVRDNSEKIINLLIDPEFKTYINPNQVTPRGKTIAYLAADYGRCEMLKTLVKAGANLAQPDNFGNTPLHVAVLNNHFVIVRFLLKHGLNPLAENNDGNSPIFCAVQSQNWKVVVLLMQHVSYSQIKKIDKELMLKKENILPINKAAIEYFPVHHAAENNQIETLDMLFADGADLQNEDIFSYTPLFLGSLSGHVDVVKWLLSHGIDMNRERLINSMIIGALVGKDWEISILLLMKIPFTKLSGLLQRLIHEKQDHLRRQMIEMKLETTELFKTIIKDQPSISTSSSSTEIKSSGVKFSFFPTVSTADTKKLVPTSEADFCSPEDKNRRIITPL